jgi:hypothetical protein
MEFLAGPGLTSICGDGYDDSFHRGEIVLAVLYELPYILTSQTSIMSYVKTENNSEKTSSR